MPDVPPYNPNVADAFGGRGSSSKSHQWAPGFGGTRYPFARLRFKGQEIPLLDNARVYGAGWHDERLVGVENPLYFISMVHQIESFVGGSNTLTIKILDPGFDYLENLLLEKAREIELFGFSIHYGYKGVDDSFFRTASTVPLVILNLDFEVVPNVGVYMTLHCVDQSAGLFEGSHYASWPETDTISRVIRSTLSKYHPEVDLKIDSTSQQVGELRNMEGMSAGQYIKMLLEHASPTGGKTPIYRTLVTSPTSSTGRATITIGELRVTRPVASYTFGRERQGEMIAFQATMNDRSMALLSGGRTTVSTIDSIEKTVATQEMLQTQDGETHGPRRAVDTPATPTNHQENPQSLSLAKSKAEGLRAVADMVMWEGTATVMGDTSLKPFDTIYVTILKNAPTGSQVQLAKANDVYWMASGVWTIKSVTHQIEAGTFVSLLELFRNGGYKGKGKGGTTLPLSFQTVKKGGDGVISRVQPLVNEDSFNADLWE